MSEKVAKEKRFDIVQFLVNNALIILIVASAIFVGLQNPRFFSMANIKNLLANTSVRMVIALGISGVLIMRNNDLLQDVRSVWLAVSVLHSYREWIMPVRYIRIWNR